MKLNVLLLILAFTSTYPQPASTSVHPAQDPWKNEDYATLPDAQAIAKDIRAAAKLDTESGIDLPVGPYRDAVLAYREGFLTILMMRGYPVYPITDSERAQIFSERLRSKRDAVSKFLFALHILDFAIPSSEAQQNQILDLKNKSLRQTIFYQYDLGHFLAVIPLAEIYLSLQGQDTDFHPHLYLYHCYAFAEQLSEKERSPSLGSPSEIRRKKNFHQLRAAEIRFGKNSPEYSRINGLQQSK
ncbi:MAG: hypothetical protein K8S54_06180 [Spirochaetia bacterium]|nr:hypothetical protein [Spirochaetia bacterium]